MIRALLRDLNAHPNEHRWLENLYGDHSRLARLLQDGPLKKDAAWAPDEYSACFREIAEHNLEPLRFPDPESPDKLRMRQSWLGAMADVADVTSLLQLDVNSEEAYRKLDSAAAALEQVFATDSSTCETLVPPSESCPHQQFFSRFAESIQRGRGFRLARDLVLDWSLADRSDWHRERFTTILMKVHGTERPARCLLTVQLAKCETGRFDPDLRFLGMAGIRHSEFEECFLRAMDAMWRVSGLSQGWRGRWRLESLPDLRDKVRHPLNYLGRSAEAATLCLLLNAVNDAEYSRFVLNSRKCISAKVDYSRVVAGQAPRQLKLLPAKGVVDKLEAARGRLDTVLFADGEDLSRLHVQAQAPVGRLRSTEQNRQLPTPVCVPDIATALDVLTLDGMRHADYRRSIAESWNGRWSGTFDATTTSSP